MQQRLPLQLQQPQQQPIYSAGGGKPNQQRGGPHHHQRRARRTPLLAALLAAALLWFAGSALLLRRLHPLGRRRADAGCVARLRALGIDLDAAADANTEGAHGGGGGGFARAAARRHQAYAEMAARLAEAGALNLGGEVTQGLTQADLFETAAAGSGSSRSGSSSSGGGGSGGGGNARPPRARLRPLAVPVRAAVLPLLDHATAQTLHDAAAAALAPVVGKESIWWQDPGLLHATVFHASTHAVSCNSWGVSSGSARRSCGHIHTNACRTSSPLQQQKAPVNATPAEVDAEAAAVAAVAAATCPVRAALERVAATPGGALVACFQVLPGGGEPGDLRASLRAALPRAPPAAAQAVREPALLHVTLARLLAPARRPGLAAAGRGKRIRGDKSEEIPPKELARELTRAARALTAELCGLEAAFDELWFVEEADLLALALGGRFRKRASLLRCRGSGVGSDGRSGGGGGAASAVDTGNRHGGRAVT